jgi:hypothetical protein
MNIDHAVPSYQAETAYRIFMRTIKEQDVSTGSISLGNGYNNGNYQTHGPSSVFDVKNVVPPSDPIQCYLWQLSTTCTVNQVDAVIAGTAVIKDYIVIEPES